MTAPKITVPAVLTLLAALTVAGCQPTGLPQLTPSPTGEPASLTASPVAAPTLDTGWTLRADTVQMYAIAFPDTWDYVFKDSPTYDADVKSVIDASTDLGKFFVDGFKNGQSSGISMIAAEPRSLQSGFVTNLSVLKTDVGATADAPSLDGISKAKREAVAKQQNVKDIKHQRVQLPAGSAEQVEYGMTSGDKTAAVSYYLASADEGGHRFVYEIIIGSTVSGAAGLFDKVAKSFRLTRATTTPAASAPAGPGGSSPAATNH